MNVIYTESELNIIHQKYLRCYQAIIRRAFHRGKIEKPFNRHHIIPKSIQTQTISIQILGMTDIEVKVGMRVWLTLKEHYIVHDLLVKIFEFENIYCYEKMIYAWNRMSDSGMIKSKDFVLFRVRHAKMVGEASKGNTIWMGRTHKQSTKDKIGAAQIGELNHNFGKHHEESTKEKLRISSTGVPQTKESRELRSISETATKAKKKELGIKRKITRKEGENIRNTTLEGDSMFGLIVIYNKILDKIDFIDEKDFPQYENTGWIKEISEEEKIKDRELKKTKIKDNNCEKELQTKVNPLEVFEF